MVAITLDTDSDSLTGTSDLGKERQLLQSFARKKRHCLLPKSSEQGLVCSLSIFNNTVRKRSVLCWFASYSSRRRALVDRLVKSIKNSET